MKTYTVSTQTSVNKHRLHAIDREDFSTCNIEEALEVFDKEVAQLRREYQTVDQIGYDISDDELTRHGVYVSIISIDEEGEPESIKDSEYFIENY